MERQELKALPAAGPAAEGPNAHLVNSHAEVKQSLEKFTQSLHQKAVQVTGWLASVDKASSARAQSLLAITIFQSVSSLGGFVVLSVDSLRWQTVRKPLGQHCLRMCYFF